MVDSLTVLAFLGVMIAPTVDLWVRPDSARSPELRERRPPAAKPALPRSMAAVASYPQQFEAYFKDNLGLRDQLLRWNSIVKLFALGVSPSPIAYLGKDGWIFYTGALTRENHRGVLERPETELESWARALESKRAMLASAGIEYLFVIAPDKETVYPEMLPEFMNKVGPTLRERFLACLSAHAPEVQILDLTEALVAAKRDDHPDDWTYGNLGTHWSGRGSQVALRALLERLDRMIGGFAPREIESFERVEIRDDDDSWTTRMYIGDMLRQVNFGMRPKVAQAKVQMQGRRTLGRIRTSEIAGSTRPRVLLMHDSFGPYIEDGLSEQCSYLEGHWERTIDMTQVASARPDVLVDLYVERSLNTLGVQGLVPIPDTWPDRFRASTHSLLRVQWTRGDGGFSAVGDAVLGPVATVPSAQLPIALKSPADRIVLPGWMPLAGEIPVLHLTLDSPIETELVLSAGANGAEYRRSLRPGTNDFYLPLDKPGSAGTLSLKPGAHANTYLLRDCEIRSVATQ